MVEWLDAPDGDGWWWISATIGAGIIVYVFGDKAEHHGKTYEWKKEWPLNKWQRVQPHTPVPPPPLPKSKMVTLTAKIDGRSAHGFALWIKPGDGQEVQTNAGTREGLRRLCREQFGIEPDMSEVIP
jgi:hypothetical protein